MISAIIAAAGSGERFGASVPKALIALGNRSLLEHALASLSSVADFIVVTAPAGFEKQIQELVGNQITVVTGGATRSESVRAGIAALPDSTEFVLIHDAARPLATGALAQRVLDQLRSGSTAVIPGLAESDTVKVVNASGEVISTPDRASLRRIQTPQGFELALLKRAHAQSGEATDDASLVEKLGTPPIVIQGEERAMKITTPTDLAQAMTFIGDAQALSTGVGIDAHAFLEGNELWLAGLLWPDEVGVAGHSDGDVAAHAICDALFAATGLGDLGSNFGTSRPEYAGASGAQLLQDTLALITKSGYSIKNVSVQVIGNRPKIGSRRVEAIAALSRALGGAEVSLLATTTDGLGVTGEGKGIAAIASALVIKR